MISKINYKELSERPFQTNDLVFNILVYTGEKKEQRPVFKKVIALEPVKVKIGSAGKEFWGIVGFDRKTEDGQWYNYNDCVSLEDWAVLDRMLKERFGWMEILDPGLVYETKERAKALFIEDK